VPSTETAGKRLEVLNFRASRVERERWEALAASSGVPLSVFIRTVLEREGRRLERERLVKTGSGYPTCTCPEVKPGVFCELCGFPKRWTIYRQWQARERMRRLRESREAGRS
jgi:hypothetical protein